MMYSSVILALYDNIQDEVIREIDWVYDEAKKEGRDELTYTEDFPRFRYMLAFMVIPYHPQVHIRLTNNMRV